MSKTSVSNRKTPSGYGGGRSGGRRMAKNALEGAAPLDRAKTEAVAAKSGIKDSTIGGNAPGGGRRAVAFAPDSRQGGREGVYLVGGGRSGCRRSKKIPAAGMQGKGNSKPIGGEIPAHSVITSAYSAGGIPSGTANATANETLGGPNVTGISTENTRTDKDRTVAPGSGEPYFARGQASGARSGKGLELPVPKVKIKKIGLRKRKRKPDLTVVPWTLEPNGGSTGSVLSLGLGISEEEWEHQEARALGVVPLAQRVNSIASSAYFASSESDTVSPPGSRALSALTWHSDSGFGLVSWDREEDEDEHSSDGNDDEDSSDENDDVDVEDAEEIHEGSIDTCPPPQYSAIAESTCDIPGQTPNQFSPLTQESASSMTSPSSHFQFFPTSPNSAFTRSVLSTPPTSAYSPSALSLPVSPQLIHKYNLTGQRSGSISSISGGSGSPSTSPEVPWNALLLDPSNGTTVVIPGVSHPGVSNSTDGGGVVSGVVNGVDVVGRPFHYMYQYQYQASGRSSPSILPGQTLSGAPGESITGIDALHPCGPTMSRPDSAPPTFVDSRTPCPPITAQTEQSLLNNPVTNLDHQHRKQRLIISGIGNPTGGDNFHLELSLILEELYMAETEEDTQEGRDEGQGDDGDCDSVIDPMLHEHENSNQRPAWKRRFSRMGGVDRRIDRSKREDGAEEAVLRWCESLGEVKEVWRRGQGCLVVEFVQEEVVESICRIQQVHIKGAGSVNLGWY